jgi:hypothetical protein
MVCCGICSSHQYFLDRGLLLTKKLLNQLSWSHQFESFTVTIYGIPVLKMATDMFCLSQSHFIFRLILTCLTLFSFPELLFSFTFNYIPYNSPGLCFSIRLYLAIFYGLRWIYTPGATAMRRAMKLLLCWSDTIAKSLLFFSRHYYRF